jgi:hypothetical protein
MTWGQLRFQLKTAAPGIADDLLDEFLNARYEQVLGKTNWRGLEASGTVQTTAAYQSGADTVTLTVGSASVVGSGTAWVTGQTGLLLYRTGDLSVYTFTYVTATSGTLDRPYDGNGSDAAGTVYANSAYVLMQDTYDLPSDLATLISALNPTTGFPLDRFSMAEMRASLGPRTLVQAPTSYAVDDDSSEQTPPVTHQIRFYPPPLNAAGIPIEYIRSATGFDGSDTNASPLPFVSNTVLLEGCRADVQLYLASQAAAAGSGGAAAAHAKLAEGYELKFTRELGRMLLEEHARRRKLAPMQMADRFTRHRMARATRGMRSNWRGGTPGGSN